MYICIDAGHGGRDLGAVGFGVSEKWVTAQVAMRVGELLHAAGCLVFLTRVGDRPLSLPQRARIARETGAELFVSLHCGQSLWPQQRGLAVHYPRTDCLSRAWAETVMRSAEERLNGRMVSLGTQPISWRHGYGGAVLLNAVRSRMPACHVDLGFLSNPQDARLLQERFFLEELARGLAGAALSWRGRLEAAAEGVGGLAPM
jgi:N-acetylmuramoyl-L-alanine amidase